MYVNLFCQQIHHLSVDALLKSNQVNEMEGGSLLGFEQDMNSGSHGYKEQCGFDETTSSAPAFRVLKQLIQRCLSDAVSSGNVFADAVLQHLYRWLCRLVLLYFLCMAFVLHSVILLLFTLLYIAALIQSFMTQHFIASFIR